MALQQKVSKRLEKELHQTKIVVRHLPPDFTEEDAQEALSPLPPNNYFYFVRGDPTLGPCGYSRAYINFTDEGEILSFRNKFDGAILGRESGIKCRTIVEYAPFQNIPKKTKVKLDPRCGTIEQDSEYTEFVKSLTEKRERPAVDVSAFIFEQLEGQKHPSVQKTPLIEFLRDKKAKGTKPKHRVIIVGKRSKDDSGKQRSRSGNPSDEKTSRRKKNEGGRSRREERQPKDRDSISSKSDARNKAKSQGDWSAKPENTRGGTAGANGGSAEMVPIDTKDAHEGGAVKGHKVVKEQDERSRRSQSSEGSDHKERRGERGGEDDRPSSRYREKPDRALYRPKIRTTDNSGGGPAAQEEVAGTREGATRRSDGYHSQRSGYHGGDGKKTSGHRGGSGY